MANGDSINFRDYRNTNLNQNSPIQNMWNDRNQPGQTPNLRGNQDWGRTGFNTYRQPGEVGLQDPTPDPEDMGKDIDWRRTIAGGPIHYQEPNLTGIGTYGPGLPFDPSRRGQVDPTYDPMRDPMHMRGPDPQSLIEREDPFRPWGWEREEPLEVTTAPPGDITETVIDEPVEDIEVEVGTPTPVETTWEAADTGVQDQGAAAFDQYANYAMGDEDPMVTAERQRMERNAILRADQAKRSAHEMAVQAGYNPGTPQYEQVMRNAITDAANQNIEAENNFNDFARERRADRQAELMNVYREGVKAEDRDREWFIDIMNTLPSHNSQAVAVLNELSGMSLEDNISSLFDENGKLKDEYKDKTTVELIREGLMMSVDAMATNPDGEDLPWTDKEKQAYVDKFYSDNLENIFFGSQQQTEGREEDQEIQTNIDNFLETGDVNKMSLNDWKGMTPDQLQQAVDKGYLKDGSAMSNQGTDWRKNQNISRSEAKRRFARKNELAQIQPGEIFVYKGQAYEMVDPLDIRERSRGQWQTLGITQEDVEYIRTRAKNLSTGETETLLESKDYEP